MINELNKEMDVDKYKIRSWSKDDFSTLAKYLNNKKNMGVIAVIAYHILILKTMRNNSSCPFLSQNEQNN